ncbi:MAG: substrate-binding domain-containing protein, partial [Sphingopyxis sp.]|nr:substrate-binding domain-containing protein [Sphingopyxis sp.]
IPGRSWAAANHWLLKVICGIEHEIIGFEKVPAGGIIVASKHQSAWETFTIAAMMPDPTFVLKRELQWLPLFGWYTMKARLIPVNRGARQVVHIAGPKHNRDARDRQRGFVDAMAKIAKERSPVILPGDFSEEAGEEAARLLIQGQLPADAVFASNDLMAVGCIQQLNEAGISVPRDVMVAGFDDIPLARHVSPALSTMQVKIDRLGSTAMMLLLRLLRVETLGAASSMVLTPTLIARGTTAGPVGLAAVAKAVAAAKEQEPP